MAQQVFVTLLVEICLKLAEMILCRHTVQAQKSSNVTFYDIKLLFNCVTNASGLVTDTETPQIIFKWLNANLLSRESFTLLEQPPFNCCAVFLPLEFPDQMPSVRDTIKL